MGQADRKTVSDTCTSGCLTPFSRDAEVVTMPSGALAEGEARVLAEHLAKMFRIYRRPSDRLRDWLSPTSRKHHREFWAVRDVTFELKPGEALGVIGANGGGKTTLLKMIAGVTRPTAGRLVTRGRSAALLELGAGFHHEFTGRQNIALNARLLGLSEEELAARMDEIIAFAELEAFIDQPVRTYSWGMYVRLGFSVASFVDPDILIIDEALAVGDLYFQRKSLDRIEYFRRIGKTIVFVSHEMRLVRRFCDTALWLNEGKVEALGPTPDVVRAYEMHMKAREVHLLGAPSADDAPAATAQEVERRRRMRVLGQTWGSGEVLITQVEMVGADGQAKWLFDLGEPVTLRISYYAFQRVENPQFGVNIHRIDGTYIYGGNNDTIHPHTFPPIEGAGAVELRIESLMLHKGRYFLSVGVYLEPDDPFWSYPADFHHQKYEFRVWSELAPHGVVPLRAAWGVASAAGQGESWGVPSRLEPGLAAGARFLRGGWETRPDGAIITGAEAEALLFVPPTAHALAVRFHAEGPVSLRLAEVGGGEVGVWKSGDRVPGVRSDRGDNRTMLSPDFQSVRTDHWQLATFPLPEAQRGRPVLFRLGADRPGVRVTAIWTE